MKDKIIIISSIILISSNFRTVIFLIDKVKMSFRQINKPSRVIRCSCIYSQEHPIIIQTFVSVIFQISSTYRDRSFILVFIYNIYLRKIRIFLIIQGNPTIAFLIKFFNNFDKASATVSTLRFPNLQTFHKKLLLSLP